MAMTPPDLPSLTALESQALLQIARQAVVAAVGGQRHWQPKMSDVPSTLLRPGACFVTLHTRGRLHGCIGSVEPRLPLALDVARNAQSAALDDPRFYPLTAAEVDDTAIEVSVLTPMQPLTYTDLDDLVRQIRPGVDGVLVGRDWQRGLLLPQVWENIPDPYDFLSHVALKASAAIDIYHHPETKVHVFQVISFTQPAPNALNTESALRIH
jgi:AmmeMemoRadiSam system protein A